MNEHILLHNQSLVDLAIQEYGGGWITGLMGILAASDVDLVNDPAAGTALQGPPGDEADPALLELKRGDVLVATGIDGGLPSPALADSDEAILDDEDDAILIDIL